MVNNKAVVFDLYDTLVYVANQTKPYTKLFGNLGLQTSEEIRLARRIALTEDFSDLARLAKRLQPHSEINLLPYEREIEKELASVAVYPETKKVLTELKDRKMRLGLISNLASPYKKPFFDLGFGEYFEEVLFSCEAGFKKPDPEIYQKMVERLGISPAEAIMVGDRVPEDVIGPRAFGMNSLHLDRLNNSPNSISTLEEIFRYL